jgi:hypothetical protein
MIGMLVVSEDVGSVTAWIGELQAGERRVPAVVRGRVCWRTTAAP